MNLCCLFHTLTRSVGCCFASTFSRYLTHADFCYIHSNQELLHPNLLLLLHLLRCSLIVLFFFLRLLSNRFRFIFARRIILFSLLHSLCIFGRLICTLIWMCCDSRFSKQKCSSYICFQFWRFDEIGPICSDVERKNNRRTWNSES